MNPLKKTETKIIVLIPYTVIQQQPPRKPKINQQLLKASSFAIITLISWLQPEATLVIALLKLLFILIG